MNILYCKKENNEEYSVIGTIHNAISLDMQTVYWNWLETMNDFIGGKTEFGAIPREQKFYDTHDRYFCEKWKDKSLKRWMPHTYDSTLLDMQAILQLQLEKLSIFDLNGVVKPKLNSCLINKYKNKNSSIRPHRDSHDTFGTNPTVIGVSLGDERTIRFKRIVYDPTNMRSIKIDKENPEEINIALPHGSVMITAGAVQKYFSHEIPKENMKKAVVNPSTRYSLTFREYI